MDPNNPYAYMDHIQRPKKNNSFTVFAVALLIVFLLAAISVAALLWMQKNDLQSKLSAEQSKTNALTVQNNNYKDKAAITPTITQTLPNGKKATFANTESNRRILFWSAGYAATDKNTVILSDTSIQAFLSGVDPAVVAKLCGPTATPTAPQSNIATAVFNTDTKATQAPTVQSCLDVLASDTNTDATLKKQAADVKTRVKNDLDGFTKDVTIKD